MCGSVETFLTIREPMLPFASKSVFFPLKKAKKKPTKAFTTYWQFVGYIVRGPTLTA